MEYNKGRECLMDKMRNMTEPVRFNYQTVKNRYFVLTDKSGYPSAEFRYRSRNRLIVAHHNNSSADPPGT